MADFEFENIDNENKNIEPQIQTQEPNDENFSPIEESNHQNFIPMNDEQQNIDYNQMGFSSNNDMNVNMNMMMDTNVLDEEE